MRQKPNGCEAFELPEPLIAMVRLVSPAWLKGRAFPTVSSRPLEELVHWLHWVNATSGVRGYNGAELVAVGAGFAKTRGKIRHLETFSDEGC